MDADDLNHERIKELAEELNAEFRKRAREGDREIPDLPVRRGASRDEGMDAIREAIRREQGPRRRALEAVLEIIEEEGD